MGVHLTRSRRGLAALAGAIAMNACSESATAPNELSQRDLAPAAIVITPGLSVYTDRTSWEAAVATAGGTVVNMDFSGLTLGRITQLVTSYGPFSIEVDDVGADQFSNPGIDVFPDASCSLGTGDCEVFTFNLLDPTSVLDGPKSNALRFPQNVIAFGGDFIQLGMTAPPPGSATGSVTLRIGAETVVVNSYLDANGNGFFGVVATASDLISFSFLKSGGLQNDIFQVYNPAYSAAPAVDPETPEGQIGDLRAVIAGYGLAGGITNALDAKLRAALTALGGGNTTAACSALQDLIDQSSAQRGKKVPVAQADAIIAAATAIRTEIGC